jgi:hypothetical protein
MSLKDRLRRLTSGSGDRNDAPSVDERDRAVAAQQGDGADDEWSALSASLKETEFGTFVHRIRRLSAADLPGTASMAHVKRHAEALAALCASNCRVVPEELLFFDTETTGLGVGAGNVPFLLGFGYLEGDGLVIEQCLMRHPGEEAAVLSYFNESLRRFRHVVTYNGKSFDWPVLRSRFVLNRLDLKDDHICHMDWLYPSRRLWRSVLPSCSLGNVEAAVLGMERESDVPGSLAPTLYFRYLSEGDAGLLHGVLLHNERDVVALAGLTGLFARLLDGRVDADRMETAELIDLAEWLDKKGKPELSDALYRRAMARPLDELRHEAMRLAAACKRRGWWREAAELWRLAANVRTADAEPFVELAKFYEHRDKRPDLALSFAEQAKEAALKRLSMCSGAEKAKQRLLLDALNRRIRRLEDKCAKTNIQPADTWYAGELF